MDPSTAVRPPSPDGSRGKDGSDGEEEEEEEELGSQSLVRHEDGDSAYSEEVGSVANYQSITASIYNFRVENGRTFHAYGDGTEYYVPNDEKEQYRMDVLYHSTQRMFDGKSFFAPVENPQRIVDMGTGTGIWALDVGDQFPSVHVVGIDLSPIQPRWVSPNVEFRIDDIDLPWVFEKPIDLIHSSLCSGSAIRSWPRYLSEAYRCLRPGGWVEAHEFWLQALSDDDTFPADSAIVEWHDLYYQSFLRGGCNLRISGQEIRDFMRAAGFVNVQLQEMKWPQAPWSTDERLKEAGALARESCLADLLGLSMVGFTRYLGWSLEDLEALVARVEEEWQRDDIHGHWPLYVVYGQKPVDSETS